MGKDRENPCLWGAGGGAGGAAIGESSTKLEVDEDGVKAFERGWGWWLPKHKRTDRIP